MSYRTDMASHVREIKFDSTWGGDGIRRLMKPQKIYLLMYNMHREYDEVFGGQHEKFKVDKPTTCSTTWDTTKPGRGVEECRELPNWWGKFFTRTKYFIFSK